MKTLPSNVRETKKTPEFDEQNIPKGLLKAHQTKEGVWAKIIIMEGSLLYTINEPELETNILNPEFPGVVEPTILHEVAPKGPVKFYVQFYE
ncbi:MAG: DUF1971 domain-containing protein [Pseudomonadota bacterium]